MTALTPNEGKVCNIFNVKMLFPRNGRLAGAVH